MNKEYYISGAVGLAIVVALLLIPAFSSDTNYFIQNNTSSNFTDTTECYNVGSGIVVVKNFTGGNCNFKSLVGSSDISITNTSNTIIIDFNGTTGSESTQCINIGSGTLIIRNSTSGNCYVRSIAVGTGLSITNSSTTITITNILPESTTCNDLGFGEFLCGGDNINIKSISTDSCLATTSNETVMIIYNICSESTFCNSTATTGVKVCEDSGNVLLKRLVAGNAISIVSNTTHITISNTNPESTFCNTLGTGTSLCGGDNINLKSLKSGTGISLSSTVNNITITNTGVISNSCTSPITCSGTNPSTIACSTCITTATVPQIAQTQFQTTQDITKTNLPTSFTDIYTTTFDDEELFRFYGANITYVRFSYAVDFVGAGTDQYQLVDANNNANVLALANTISADCVECTTGWIAKPSWVGTSEYIIELQGKSSNGTNDPIFKGYIFEVK